MKKILVPVDFSEHTEGACSYAIEFAGQHGATIRLFHTYSDQFIIADSSFPDAIDMSTMYNEELLKEILHQSEKKMSDLKKELESKVTRENRKSIVFESKIAAGEIERELTDLMAEFQPDLVVMGTKGIGKSLNMWGSVSNHIINNSLIPVMTVPEMKKFKGFKKIMLAAGLSDRNMDSIDKLFTLFAEFQSHIECIHFLIPEETENNEGMEVLKEHFGREEKAGKINFRFVEVTDKKQNAIRKEIDDLSIDIIAFQPRKHNVFYNLFTRQITKKDLRATNVPLLALPALESKD